MMIFEDFLICTTLEYQRYVKMYFFSFFFFPLNIKMYLNVI